ncbi:TPA: Asp-tRNA(Asn)/Glu-tRNA(Gln) amidotransferase GatCAB subunit A [Candidatus Campbellbacteria bacterium]|uniref:Glutamyl-tRNA(Gln) amidotransferase subunit A n=1 Tax=Candidatus Nomurabacteria bacterium GW2011_GWC2_42_20 TaxID=1618756 RepID=A0A0G1BQ18_9BACT|nr:MAG: Glutamyl-tRNA(Gln) amidotransferase subunit A [Parcubacteria group bacterium GW2011_GWC1_42_11]KKS48326.1 MAG: Glutamyl-tRNA(Gln) amidotransferase subunit A [Candidatus Nomurabacteria bacterium GW2011_GWC2_42_20]KKT09902.1 MAG: Glutamyl-tRNA(Gln) amidotransferase subunit A [Candidatus Nomurabacteria bacterium GW2011_GWB1_43_20]TAN35598.1 MAG: Asp-tRNA(Asn)/Glu-tRNA(Gln) amidotransferase subunit GatA [Patescibacteria group bacterium]HBC70742.1 Asp-tRNA(Asn)/Glu-tRNA(Gln) amidotransferase
MDAKNLTIKQAHELLISKKMSVLELVEAVLKVADGARDLNAYLEIFDDVREQVEVAQKMIDDGRSTMMTGIPIAMKDNILIKGKIASASSKMLENYTATYDAFVTKKLRDAGAVFIGRTNMDEFAMGGSTENSAFGVTKNPHDKTRVPGGSSGGSAAALASGSALGALGTDTGGSIRQPAAFCGVVGLKPTYGSVSRSGIIAMASSLDQAGPFAKTVEDAEIIFDCIKGYDPMDSTSEPAGESPDFVSSDERLGRNPDNLAKKEPKKPKVIGVPTEFVNAKGVDPRVLKNFEESIEKMKKLGYEVKEINLASLKQGLSIYYILMPAEVSSNLARFDGVRYGYHANGANLLDDYMRSRGEGFGGEVRRRILLGTYVLSSGYYDAYYSKAVAAREVIKKTLEVAFRDVDIIATPTTPTPAFRIGEKSSDPLQMYLADIFTVPVNIAGVPAISIPSGFVEEGDALLPLGIQFIAPHFGEDALFATGKDFEKMLGDNNI